jgi:hypothetical protein
LLRVPSTQFQIVTHWAWGSVAVSGIDEYGLATMFGKWKGGGYAGGSPADYDYVSV